mmetsp:Transcript_14714/g.21010  ORF Transcript_14714/g.21010 Transcript_14714/m.21010 type:complete len:458 (+) Transcript_14714:29-1402(+)
MGTAATKTSFFLLFFDESLMKMDLRAINYRKCFCCLFQLFTVMTTCFSTIKCIQLSSSIKYSPAFLAGNRCCYSSRQFLLYRKSVSVLHDASKNLDGNSTTKKGFIKFNDIANSKANLGKKKGKRKRQLFTDEVFSTSETNLAKKDNGPLLDRFGLPIPTEYDLFPPMPEGTEIISATEKQHNSIVTQQELNNLLAKHAVSLDMSVLAKMPTTEQNPMKLRILHASPPVFAIDNFFTKEECQYCIDLVQTSSPTMDGNPKDDKDIMEVRSATFSSSYLAVQSKRTSTTWYVKYRTMPTLLAKLTNLLGKISLEQCEEPQIVRYRKGEEFSWHYDEVPASQLANGGQRIATALVYLNDVHGGGETVFRDLSSTNTQQQLSMTPQQGSLLLFFPSFANGLPDKRTLHKGEKVDGNTPKMIVQMWVHQNKYIPALPKGNLHSNALEAIRVKEVELGLRTL